MKNEKIFEISEKPIVSQIKCVVLDYDGTLTTLRRGWDVILNQYAQSTINPNSCNPVSGLEGSIRHLCEHAGGTTPRQLMTRLVALIEEYKLVPKNRIKTIDEYALKYTHIFQKAIDLRLTNFDEESEQYVIQGVRPLLQFLNKQSTVNYVVTGSNAHAVSKELNKLSMKQFFTQIYGATLETTGNLKENAIKEIMTRHALKKSEILVIGDGSTEIRAAKTLGLPSIGIASDEHKGGLCPNKRRSLLALGAHVIIADYSSFPDLWEWLHS